MQILKIILYAYEYSAYMYVVHCVWRVPLEEKGFAGAPGTGVAYGYELSYGFSEFNLGPLKEQLVLLIQSHFLTTRV